MKPIRLKEPAAPRTVPLPEATEVPPVENTGPTDVPPVENTPGETLPPKREDSLEPTNVVRQITLLPPVSPETNSLSAVTTRAALPPEPEAAAATNAVVPVGAVLSGLANPDGTVPPPWERHNLKQKNEEKAQ